MAAEVQQPWREEVIFRDLKSLSKYGKNRIVAKMTAAQAGPQRENFPGGTKVNTGPPNLIGPPKPYRGPCR